MVCSLVVSIATFPLCRDGGEMFAQSEHRPIWGFSTCHKFSLFWNGTRLAIQLDHLIIDDECEWWWMCVCSVCCWARWFRWFSVLFAADRGKEYMLLLHVLMVLIMLKLNDPCEINSEWIRLSNALFMYI